jgi:hypothetical protein
MNVSCQVAVAIGSLFGTARDFVALIRVASGCRASFVGVIRVDCA